MCSLGGFAFARTAFFNNLVIFFPMVKRVLYCLKAVQIICLH